MCVGLWAEGRPDPRMAGVAVRGANLFAGSQVIDAQLKNAVYNPKKTDDLSAAVINAIIKDLLELKKPFKYAGPARTAVRRPFPLTPAPTPRSSDLHSDAKDGGWAPHGCDVFLGQQDGWCAAAALQHPITLGGGLGAPHSRPGPQGFARSHGRTTPCIAL